MTVRRRIFACALLIVAASILFAAAPAHIIPPTSRLTVLEIDWQDVPTSTDIGIAETIWLDSIQFGTASTGRTVTVTARAGTAKSPINAVSLAANQYTSIVFPSGGMRLTGGFNIVASGAGVVYQFRGRVSR
jgi:hypothetical protein